MASCFEDIGQLGLSEGRIRLLLGLRWLGQFWNDPDMSQTSDTFGCGPENMATLKGKNMIKKLDLGVPKLWLKNWILGVPNYRWWQRPYFTCYLTLHPWICRSNPVFWGCPGIHLDWRPRFCTYPGTSSSSSSSWQPHLQPVLYPDVSCGHAPGQRR